MSELFKKNWLFLCLAIVVSFALNGITTDSVFANTNEVDPSVTFNGEADVPNPPMGEAGYLSRAVVVDWDDTNDIADDSAITITAPSGTKFSNITAVAVTLPAGTTVEAPDGSALSSGKLTDKFLSGSDNMEIKIIVTSSGATGPISIGSSTALAQICLVPKDDDITAGTANTNLPLSVTVNSGNSNASTSTFQSINLLKRPDIKLVDEVSSTEIKVTLMAPIGGATKTNFYVSEDDADRSNPVMPTEANLDTNDKTKVSLILPNTFTLDFDKKPSVWIMGSKTASTALVHEDDRTGVEARVANGSTKPMPIRMAAVAGDPNPTVLNNKDVLGINGFNAANESTNELRANIKSTNGSPLKLKIVFDSDTQMNAPLDLTNVVANVSGFAALSTEDNAEDSDELNDDVLCIPGEQNDGDIDVIFKLGKSGGDNFAFNAVGDDDGLLPLVDAAKAIAKGDEKKLKVIVSPDDFMEKVGFDTFNVDKKSPTLIKTGDDKPKAESDRKTIKLTFSEPLDPTATEDKKDWQIVGSASGTLDEDDIDSIKVDTGSMTTVCIKIKGLFQDKETITVKVREGTPTAVPGDKFFNPIECATNTSAFVTLNTTPIDAPDLTKPTKSAVSWKPSTAGNTGVSDNKPQVTITANADTSSDRSRFVFQAFGQDTSDTVLGIDFDNQITGPFLGNDNNPNPDGFDVLNPLNETDPGVYVGKVTLQASKLNDGDKIVLLCGVLDGGKGIPDIQTRKDWEDLNPAPLSTGPLDVDNQVPTVVSANKVDGTTNQFMVDFSEEMQIASLRDRFPTVECGTDALTVNTVSIAGASDDALYTLFEDFPADTSCTVAFPPVDSIRPSDKNGNEMDDDNETTILDEAPTTTTTVADTTTTTVGDGTTTTTVGDGTTTTTVGDGTTTTTVGDGTTTTVVETTTTTQVPTTTTTLSDRDQRRCDRRARFPFLDRIFGELDFCPEDGAEN